MTPGFAVLRTFRVRGPRRGRTFDSRLIATAEVAALAIVLIFALAVGVAYANTRGAFNSPDDASNYATARAIVQDGRPWLEHPHGVEDEFDLLHPRAFVSVDDRAVPIQSLATAVHHAFIWKLTGSYAPSTGVYFALGVCGWVCLAARLFGLRFGVALLAFALATPLLYWMTRQYFTVSTYLLWLPWALWGLCEALRLRSYVVAILSGAMHGVALAARPDFLVAHFLAIPIVVGYAGTSSISARTLPLVVLHACTAGLVFAVVILGTNHVFFDSPFTFGYDLARAQPGFDEPLSIGLPVVDTVLARAFPLGLADPMDAASYLLRYTLLLSPVFTVVAGIGMMIPHNGRTTDRFLLVVGSVAFILYFAFSRSSENLQGSTAPDPLPSHSVVRYYLPMYVLLSFFAVRAYSWMVVRRALGHGAAVGAGLLSAIGVGLTLWQVLFAYQGVSLLPWSQNLAARQTVFEQIFQTTEPDALIVAPTYDKFAVSTGRYSLSWSTVGQNNGFRPDEVAETIRRVVEAGGPVYVWDTQEVGARFAQELCDRSLWIQQLQTRFYRVIVDSECDLRIEKLFPRE